MDRNFGQEELKRHKVKILQSKEFFNFQDAISFVKKDPDAYVIKPCGETQELKQLLFVGSDDEASDELTT